MMLVAVCLLVVSAAPLPKPTDLPPSKQAADRALSLFEQCPTEGELCAASWRKAVAIDPSNVFIRAAIADSEYGAGHRDDALAITDQLASSACRACLEVLIKTRDRAWANDRPFADRVRNGIKGRKSKYSAAAALVVAALTSGNWAQLAPFIPKAGVRWLPDEGPMTAAQIKRLLEPVSRQEKFILASGLTTCEGDCCSEIWDTLGGDEPSYLMQMCFAPGPLLVSMTWDSPGGE